MVLFKIWHWKDFFTYLQFKYGHAFFKIPSIQIYMCPGIL